MSHLRIALLQIAPCGPDVEANLRKGLEYCRRAAKKGADLALFPEMWSVGYAPSDGTSLDEWLARAVRREGPFVESFRRRAADLGMAVGITYLEGTGSGAARNSFVLFDREGRDVLHYSKTHLCGWEPPESALEAGTELSVGDLPTRLGVVRVGALICFDREMPEPTAVLMRKGAEIVLVPNACELDEGSDGVGDVRLAQFRARAYENYLALFMANYPAPKNDGRSIAVGPDGRIVAEAGPDEQILCADLDLDGLRALRRREIERDARRRPDLYGPLTETGVPTPLDDAAS